MKFLSLLVLMLAASPVFADQFWFQVSAPDKEIIYTSPRNLIASLVGLHKVFPVPSERDDFYELAQPPINDDASVGHTIFGIECDADGDLPEIKVKDFISDKYASSQHEKIFTEKVGFSFAFDGTPGRLWGEEAASTYMNAFAGRKDFARLTIKISSKTCRRLYAYYTEFDRLKIADRFSLNARPRYKEGAGCSSLGVSFLEIGGLLTPETLEQWVRSVRVPNALMGRPYFNREIEPENLITHAASKRWAKSNEAHHLLRFYEPQKMRDWIKDFATETDGTFAEDLERPVEVVALPEKKFYSVTLDESDRETPTEGFWLTNPGKVRKRL